MNLPEGTHLAWTDFRRTWYASRNPVREISISTRDWSFQIAEVNLGGHGTALQLRIFEDAFAAFTQIPEFFRELALVPCLTLDGAAFLLSELGAVDETPEDAPYRADADPAEKAAAVIRDHPAGTRDYREALALARAVLAEAGASKTDPGREVKT